MSYFILCNQKISTLSDEYYMKMTKPVAVKLHDE